MPKLLPLPIALPILARTPAPTPTLARPAVQALFVSLALFACPAARAQSPTPAGAQHAIPIIFDTDMGPDYDDVGAIALLHAFADSGKCTILATMASNRYEGVAAVLNVFNTYFHRPDIPIGVPGGNAPDIRDKQHWTDSLLANYPHAINQNTDANYAVTLYRKVLAKQPDHSVVIVTVGFLTNLADLLETNPDDISPLDGLELAKKKVRLLVSMAGAFPRGKEFNINRDVSAALAVSKDWPSPIIYSGFEIGKRIKCGLPLVNNNTIQHDPVKDVFRISIPQSPEDAQGRSSWDETAVLVAINGYAPWYSLRHGHIVIDTFGSNTWEDSMDEKQSHLVEALPATTVQHLIDHLMMHQPQ
ncbi:nucleoside hydrolase [Puia dinghuensis]|uniref:Nucleoside hydrolase n=1 Tax=Puia dinghuensis TaxID=1792502 RepID=A0A8J2UIY2_9BACT|nr:nucleoside hydrolase [Puia dinghuensis]GGB25018.1 nucleoside hydrolase [Puia dinghuensis]